ncbi:MAG TPA: saccharopine dehydrogenase C-terminal domain-containing protein [Phycisphaerae bacterium]|nr:saccharopine dehydrogenase C-terminal domain-containing protein [Phycisphaerae bacterium]
MKKILVLGAGQSSPFLISYLLENAEANGWFVTVADRDANAAAKRVAGHSRGDAIALNANDMAILTAQIKKSDVVVNMLAPSFQHLVAWECVQHGTHMISASYRDQRVRDLHTDAQRADVLILCECGLDPGIDHMSAMSLINHVRNHGGLVEGFLSYGSGIPAPDSLSNPMKYAITWNPRNVVMAAEHGAQYLITGQIKIVPHWQVFRRSWVVDVEGLGTMEAYPNRDSLSYKKIYGLDNAETMIRGTLRYPGWSETWLQIVRLGLPNEELRIPDLPNRTFAEVVEMFLPRNTSGDNLAQRVANHLQISPTGHIMEKLKWLGLFSEEPTGVDGETSAEVLSHLLQKKLALGETERDMVVLVHELEVRYPEENNRGEKVISTLIEHGEPNSFTAMSKTVGLPAAIAAKLLLTDDLPITGSHIPTHAAIYSAILPELEAAGLTFKKSTRPLK